MKNFTNNNVSIETLESRQLMTAVAVPLAITQVAAPTGGTELVINGSNGNDQITVKQTVAGLVIGNTGGWQTTITGVFKDIKVYTNSGNDSVVIDNSVNINCKLYAGSGSDSLTGGAGNDQLFGGTGRDLLTAGLGSDTIVSLKSGLDTVVGGAGFDSFWVSATDKLQNVTANEIAQGAVHLISNWFAGNGGTVVQNNGLGLAYNGHGHTVSFHTGRHAPAIVAPKPTPAPAPAPSTGVNLLAGGTVNPATTENDITYKNFAKSALFSDNGPSENDIVQGYVGDCYFLSTLSTTAKLDANRIRQSVCDLGDGTFAVQFMQNNKAVFVRVNADLPTWNWGALAYADKGAQGSIWTGVMEKAWAIFRGPTASYNSIDGGWMDEVYTALNATNIGSAYNWASGTQLLQQIQGKLSAGYSVTLGTPDTITGGVAMINDHAYTVDRINIDAKGNLTVTVRNPWAVDGTSGAGTDGHNDGYITLTGTQVLANCDGVVWAKV